MPKYHLFGIGNALVDTEFLVSDDFLASHKLKKGETTLSNQDEQEALLSQLKAAGYQPAKKACGGSAANTIIGAAQFGADCYYACKVSDDKQGRFYKADLQENGVHSNLNQQALETGVTGSCVVLVTPDAQRTMQTFLGISAGISPQQLEVEAITNAGITYLEGYLSSSNTGTLAAIEAARIARANQKKVAVTFSDPAMVSFFKPALSNIIGTGVDLLFCNEQEALTWSETNSIDLAVEHLKTISSHFIITLGDKGALLFDGEKAISIDAKKVEAIDTNGAGDLFAAAYLYGMTHQHSNERCLELAVEATAQLITQFGPRLNQSQQLTLLQKLNLLPQQK